MAMAGKHALIVDDNAENVNILAQLLSMEGVTSTRIQRSSQLQDALATLPHVNIVFLDLEMPGVDGYQALELIKADEHLKNIPVVAYTVHLSDINRARDKGFHSFLGKPL